MFRMHSIWCSTIGVAPIVAGVTIPQSLSESPGQKQRVMGHLPAALSVISVPVSVGLPYMAGHVT